jgi:hypothetical protein
MSRRRFFAALFQESQALTGALQGTRNLPLSGLRDLCDDELGGLIPMINPPLTIEVADDRLWARNRETGGRIVLFEASPENVIALNLFDGEMNLATAGWRLALQMGWPEEEGFYHVKELFLWLVGRLVYSPRYSPSLEDEKGS